MPYNYLGDLHKREVVERLNQMGCSIKSVHELNLILQEMGLLKHESGYWHTTQSGAKFTLEHEHVLNAEAWHPTIVNEVYSYLQRKREI